MRNLLVSVFTLVWLSPIFCQVGQLYPTCEEAAEDPIFSADQLENHVFSLLDTINTAAPLPLCPSNGNGAPNNTSWISFILGEDAEDFDIEIHISNCIINEGIQWGIVENCNYDVVICDGGCTNNTFYSLIAPDLIPCQQYWLWVDGCNGNVCDFEFIVNAGFEIPDSSLSNFYYDFDMDGFGDPDSVLTTLCQLPKFVQDSTDCNDTNANVYPMAPEICDGLDNDCDGEIDEGLTYLDYYADNDMDGYGNPDSIINSCIQPIGFTLDNTDCDDSNASVFPDAVEICDEIDNNCNGEIDEGATINYYVDNDQDGFGDASNFITSCSPPTGYVLNNTDCDDTNASINPDAVEICDEIDNNCNGGVDEGLPTFDSFIDMDGDGFGSTSTVINSCFLPQGYVLNNMDCDDLNFNINPDVSEICDDLDNNCNGQIDEGFTFSNYYADEDMDGFGNPFEFVHTCSQPQGYVTNNMDCDDTTASINPDAEDIPDNGIDEDCDGLDATSGIHELEGYTIKIFPNPTNGIVNIEINKSINLRVELYDINGKMLLGNNDSQIDLTLFTNGVYILSLSTNDFKNHIVERIVLER